MTRIKVPFAINGDKTLVPNDITLDGDEISQGRMARAIVAINDTDTTMWVLANNTPTSITKAQLTQALKLAGEAQTALWIKP